MIFIEIFNIFLNVLEQFAIRVVIFNVDLEDIINYVNKLYFTNNDDNFISSFIDESGIDKNINPERIILDFRNNQDYYLNNLSSPKFILFQTIIYIY